MKTKTGSGFWANWLPLVVLALLLPAGPVWADRGHLILADEHLSPNINIRESGQKAIIAWNGKEEILILSTDLASDKPVTVLEFMPLPAKPSAVKTRTFAPFETIGSLIDAHAPLAQDHEMFRTSAGAANKGEAAPVQVVFHEQVGAHEVTVARTRNMEAFVSWIKGFLAARKLKFREEFFARLRPVVRGYLDDGMYYYVFDVVKLTPKTQSIEPILYRFPSSRLYYPLRVSTLGTGRTHIDLFLISPLKLDIWGSATGFWSGFYRGSRDEPIKFVLSADDLARIDPMLVNFFSQSGPIWLTTASYRGLVSGLIRDFYGSK